MARSRLLDPRFFMDAELADAERAAGLPLRLAYAALWCQADREGRFAWKPRELKLGCLPYDDVDFAAVLDLLADLDKIQRYEINGRAYGFIPNFLLFQRPHPRETESQIPPMPTQGKPKASPRRAQGEPRRTMNSGLPVVTESVAVADEEAPAVPAASAAAADSGDHETPCMPPIVDLSPNPLVAKLVSVVAGLSPALTTALQPFLAQARYPASITGEVRAALDGMRGTVWPEATVIQALTDMQAANVSPFSPRAFRAFLQGVADESTRSRERKADANAAASRAEGQRHKASPPPRLTGLPPDQVPDVGALLAAEGLVRPGTPMDASGEPSPDQKREGFRQAAAQAATDHARGAA